VIDWLLRGRAEPQVEVAGRVLPVAIRRLPRAKRLTMRLATDGSEVRVTMPPWARTQDALAFAQDRTSWIEAQLARVPQVLAVGHGASLPYRGASLLIEWQAKAPRRPAIADGRMVLGGPEESLAPRVQRWLEAQALDHAGADLAHYCARAGIAPPLLRLSRARRRWGSCTSERGGDRCIRINWRLIMAPDHVRRSVVAHEVAHLTHFDHSPAFHAQLALLFEGDVAEADGWLKREGRTLYAAFG
jgi:predicted metal-dependent hydrolase